MTETNRPKPASYGFDLDFSDLTNVKPIGVQGREPKAAPAVKTKPASSKPRAVNPISSSESPEAGRRSSAPKPAVVKAQERASDAIAKSMGFSARESQPLTLKKRRRTHHDEPVDQLSIRGPVRILNQFIDHCEAKNLSYWEALEQLIPKP